MCRAPPCPTRNTNPKTLNPCAAQAPTPRLEAVAGQLLGGRLIVFGGSTTHNDAACTDVYTVNLEAERPAWQKISVRGDAPERGWGFSACTIGGSKVRPGPPLRPTEAMPGGAPTPLQTFMWTGFLGIGPG